MTELWNVIRNFFTKKHIVYYICFIILYRFAEGFVMKIVPLFLKAGRDVGGLGLTEQEIGIYYGTFGAAAFVLGSLLGGYYISARGLKKTLFSLCCVFNLPFMAYTLLAIFQPQSAPLIGGAIVLEYFGYGFGFVGAYLVHDATGGCRPSSDGALCFCIGYHEPGCHAARYDVRICQRLAGL